MQQSPTPGTGKPFEVDMSEPGVMFIRWTRQASSAESQELMAEIEKLWAAKKKYCAAIETHPAVNADARHRSLWGEWHAKNKEAISTYCVGMAVTLDSAIVRGLMTAISWFAKDQYPIKYVATAEEARAWARRRIAESRAPAQA